VSGRSRAITWWATTRRSSFCATNHRVDENYDSQPGALFRLMTPAQQQVLFENTTRSVGGASKAIQERHIANCAKADPTYRRGPFSLA